MFKIRMTNIKQHIYI